MPNQDNIIPSDMKVTELKQALSDRNLSTKGLKKELIARLEEALEATSEPENAEIDVVNESSVPEEPLPSVNIQPEANGTLPSEDTSCEIISEPTSSAIDVLSNQEPNIVQPDVLIKENVNTIQSTESEQLGMDRMYDPVPSKPNDDSNEKIIATPIDSEKMDSDRMEDPVLSTSKDDSLKREVTHSTESEFVETDRMHDPVSLSKDESTKEDAITQTQESEKIETDRMDDTVPLIPIDSIKEEINKTQTTEAEHMDADTADNSISPIVKEDVSMSPKAISKETITENSSAVVDITQNSSHIVSVEQISTLESSTLVVSEQIQTSEKIFKESSEVQNDLEEQSLNNISSAEQQSRNNKMDDIVESISDEQQTENSLKDASSKHLTSDFENTTDSKLNLVDNIASNGHSIPLTSEAETGHKDTESTSGHEVNNSQFKDNDVSAFDDEAVSFQSSPIHEISMNFTPDKNTQNQSNSQAPQVNNSGEPLKFIAITNLTRPFPLGDFEEQLKEYGPIIQFWIDKFRSHCYVQYENGEAASLCKSMLSGVQFPPDTGKKLGVALLDDSEGLVLLQKEKSSSQRFILALEGDKPELQEYNDNKKPLARGLPSSRRPLPQDAVQNEDRKRQHISLPPQLPLDRLFLKTSTKPCLYYKPNKSLNSDRAENNKMSDDAFASESRINNAHSTSSKN